MRKQLDDDFQNVQDI